MCVRQAEDPSHLIIWKFVFDMFCSFSHLFFMLTMFNVLSMQISRIEVYFFH